MYIQAKLQGCEIPEPKNQFEEIKEEIITTIDENQQLRLNKIRQERLALKQKERSCG